MEITKSTHEHLFLHILLLSSMNTVKTKGKDESPYFRSDNNVHSWLSWNEQLQIYQIYMHLFFRLCILAADTAATPLLEDSTVTDVVTRAL